MEDGHASFLTLGSRSALGGHAASWRAHLFWRSKYYFSRVLFPDVPGGEPALQLISRFAVVAGWRAEAACSKITKGGGWRGREL